MPHENATPSVQPLPRRTHFDMCWNGDAGQAQGSLDDLCEVFADTASRGSVPSTGGRCESQQLPLCGARVRWQRAIEGVVRTEVACQQRCSLVNTLEGELVDGGGGGCGGGGGG